jgi:hypothetical protein
MTLSIRGSSAEPDAASRRGGHPALAVPLKRSPVHLLFPVKNMNVPFFLPMSMENVPVPFSFQTGWSPVLCLFRRTGQKLGECVTHLRKARVNQSCQIRESFHVVLIGECF